MAMPSAVSLPSNPDRAFYGNSLRSLLTDPNSFKTDPGYGFAFDQAMQGVNRSNSKMLGSGNQLSALLDRASGMASQAYGNRVDELTRLSGQADQYDLGAGQNAIGAARTANDYALGEGQLGATNTRNANDFALGEGNLGLGLYRAGNDYSLGQGQNNNNTMRNLIDLNLGEGQNANTAQRNANDFDLGGRAAGTNFYDAQTRRGSARSNAFLGGQGNALDWTKYYATQYPRRIIGGGGNQVSINGIDTLTGRPVGQP